MGTPASCRALIRGRWRFSPRPPATTRFACCARHGGHARADRALAAALEWGLRLHAAPLYAGDGGSHLARRRRRASPAARDAEVMLEQTVHWRPLLNGDSGFMPRPYTREMEVLTSPAGEDALRLLRETRRSCSSRPCTGGRS